MRFRAVVFRQMRARRPTRCSAGRLPGRVMRKRHLHEHREPVSQGLGAGHRLGAGSRDMGLV